MKYGIGKNLKIKRDQDFSRVFSEGRRANDRLLTVFVVKNNLAYSRLGVAISRQLGNAVRRNRAKRLCREAFRLVRGELPTGCDYILLPRNTAELTLEGLKESIRTLAGRLAE